MVTSPRGDARFSVLLDTQRWRAAYHLRQVERMTGTTLLPPLDALPLPTEVV